MYKRQALLCIVLFCKSELHLKPLAPAPHATPCALRELLPKEFLHLQIRRGLPAAPRIFKRCLMKFQPAEGPIRHTAPPGMKGGASQTCWNRSPTEHTETAVPGALQPRERPGSAAIGWAALAFRPPPTARGSARVRSSY